MRAWPPQVWVARELLDGLQSARAMVASAPGLLNALLVADALVEQRSAASLTGDGDVGGAGSSVC